jgi:hypothetical protein
VTLHNISRWLLQLLHDAVTHRTPVLTARPAVQLSALAHQRCCSHAAQMLQLFPQGTCSKAL